MQMKEVCKETVAIIPAGGRGERLMPLTEHRAKSAVPFGGKYRIIDFVLSNCIRSGLSKILVIPQYKFDSLIRHLNLGWDIFSPEKNEYLRVLPPQMRVSNGWYQGTADAVYQNIYSLRVDRPKYVLVLSGDQIYRMDYRQLLIYHKEKEAELTIAAVEVDCETARQCGILEIDEEGRVIGFEEKPEHPKPLPGRREKYLASMGIYAFNSPALIRELEKDMIDGDSEHDFGRSIIPRMIKNRTFAFLFQDEPTGEVSYWRDVGTIESYFEANMDLVGIQPKFNLYDKDWPWRTLGRQLPPAKIVFQATVEESIISEGCIIDEGRMVHSILSPGVKIGKGAEIINSVIMDDVQIGEQVRVVRAIIDKGNVIPAGSIIEAGNMKYCGRSEISSTGIIVVPRYHINWKGE